MRAPSKAEAICLEKGKALKILFVSSATIRGLVPFIKVQGESLIDRGHELEFFLITKGGISGYRDAVKELRERIKREPVDVIHAHYSLVGTVALLAARNTGIPVVCSFMGSDIHGAIGPGKKVKRSSYPVILNSLLIQTFLDHIIVKSAGLTKRLLSKKLPYSVIPNGVNTEMFKPLDRRSCREELELPQAAKIWLFVGNPKVSIKNHQLFEGIRKEVEDEDNIFLAPYPVPHADLNKYYNAADAMLLCSFAEGSPNAVKECMAANTPVISTPVGDVDFLFSGKPKGYYIADFSVASFKEAMDKIRTLDDNPGGRKAVEDLGLEDKIIAERLENIYSELTAK